MRLGQIRSGAAVTAAIFEGGSARARSVDQISGNWVNAHGNPHTLAVCLETSWNTPGSTTERYLAVGRQLGQAIERYLRQNPRE